MKKTVSRANKLKWNELSKTLRTAHPICEYCKKEPSAQTHHIISKYFMKSLLRYDVINLVCLDAKCHFLFHKNPVITMEWLRINRPESYRYLLEKCNG
jgi:hypothetical protein